MDLEGRPASSSMIRWKDMERSDFHDQGILYSKGGVYEGDFAKNKAEGNGICKYRDRRTYIGQ